MTTFEPTSNGIDADQLVVPLAVPDCPILVDHTTDVTPALSLAVPLNTIVDDDVETVVAPGDAMVNVGGVALVLVPVVGGVAGGTGCLVTVTTCDTWLEPAVAVTVIVFTPIASGIFEIVQAEEPLATPDIAIDEDAVDQITEIAPEPPVAVPDKFNVAAVVTAAVEEMLSVKEDVGEVGVGVGAGVGALGCAAYNVCTAAISSAVRPETIL